MISVQAVQTGSHWRAFRRVPRAAYRHDPNWIPIELVDIDRFLINPSPQRRARATTQAFVAFDEGKPVGRVVAIADHDFISHSRTRCCFFGFYEAVADDEVAFALLDEVRTWALGRSLTQLCGPFNPSMVYGAGVLVGEAAQRPLIGMPHNPGYYATHLERWGMTGVKDFHSYLIADPYSLLHSPAFATQFAMWQRFSARSPVTFRSMTHQSFDRDLETVRTLYNRAFGNFIGFAPLPAEEMQDLADTVRPILDLQLTVIAEIDCRPVGFLMAIPDVNELASRSALRWQANLWSRTLRQRLTGAATPMTANIRVDMLVVDPDCGYQPTAGLLLVEMLRRIHDRGYATVEGAPVLEDGSWIQPFRRKLNLTPHRTYRLYSKDITNSLERRGEPQSNAEQLLAV